jgi:hypothetical protein
MDFRSVVPQYHLRESRGCRKLQGSPGQVGLGREGIVGVGLGSFGGAKTPRAATAWQLASIPQASARVCLSAACALFQQHHRGGLVGWLEAVYVSASLDTTPTPPPSPSLLA